VPWSRCLGIHHTAITQSSNVVDWRMWLAWGHLARGHPLIWRSLKYGIFDRHSKPWIWMWTFIPRTSVCLENIPFHDHLQYNASRTLESLANIADIDPWIYVRNHTTLVRPTDGSTVFLACQRLFHQFRFQLCMVKVHGNTDVHSSTP